MRSAMGDYLGLAPAIGELARSFVSDTFAGSSNECCLHIDR